MVQAGQISERSAWKSQAIGGKEGLVFRFSAEQLATLRRLAARLLPRSPDSISREEFDDPLLNPLFSAVKSELSGGRGAVILSGIPRQEFDEVALARIFWGIGTHLGVGVAQNLKGDRIDHIRDSADNPLGRKQYGRDELVLHTDNPTGEILGLMCLQKAMAGGESQFASALAIHNEIRATRPDYLRALYQGFPYHRKGRQPPSEPVITPFDVPVYSSIGGVVSCHYIREYMETAAKLGAKSMPPLYREALDFFDAVANRDDVKVSFSLEPGEIVFVNNLTVLHARTAFDDHADIQMRRHLLRLWLHVPGGRPYAPAMDMFWRGPVAEPDGRNVV